MRIVLGLLRTAVTVIVLGLVACGGNVSAPERAPAAEPAIAPEAVVGKSSERDRVFPPWS
jgi:hypothetical protein